MNIRELIQDDSPAAQERRAATIRAQHTEIRETDARPGRTVRREYASARHSRLTSNWATSTTSADAEIRQSLDALRGRCRALDRDSAYAKRAKKVVVDNVIGVGIGIKGNVQTTRGQQNKPVNREIERAWRNYWEDPDQCHTGGELAAGEYERLIMGEVFEAGEMFIRMHRRPFGKSKIPFCLEAIESERVPHGVMADITSPNNSLRMGVEVDKFYRPVGYWLRDYHPGEFMYPRQSNQQNNLEYVRAEDMIHLRILDRWPQTRGVPWLHAVAKKINDMDGYSEAEIVAARGSANYMGHIETDPMLEVGEEQEDGTYEMEVAPGIVMRLAPGEKFTFHSPNRPNTALDPFMRYMLRETAAGANVSYESLSRDYSQSNYSSSRLSLLEDRDAWRVLQSLFVMKVRKRIHKEWLNAAVLSRQIVSVPLITYGADPVRYSAAKFKPRGWGWVDPAKEVKAYREAEQAGYTTKTQIISETAGGRDIDDVFEERQAELELAAELGLEFDTSTPAAEETPPPDNVDDDDNDDDDDGEQTTTTVRAIK